MAEQGYLPPPRPAAPPLQQQQHQQQYQQQYQPYAHPPTTAHPAPEPLMPSTPNDLAKSESRRLYTQKAVTTLSAGLLSVLVIGLSYVAVFASAEIFRTTIAPLASASVLMVAAIIAAVYLCALPGVLSKLATIPIVFSITGGAMIVVLNAASRSLSEGGFVKIDFVAVLLSGGVFGGLGLGVTMGFVLFACNGQWRFEI